MHGSSVIRGRVGFSNMGHTTVFSIFLATYKGVYGNNLRNSKKMACVSLVRSSNHREKDTANNLVANAFRA